MRGCVKCAGYDFNTLHPSLAPFCPAPGLVQRFGVHDEDDGASNSSAGPWADPGAAKSTPPDNVPCRRRSSHRACTLPLRVLFLPAVGAPQEKGQGRLNSRRTIYRQLNARLALPGNPNSATYAEFVTFLPSLVHTHTHRDTVKRILFSHPNHDPINLYLCFSPPFSNAHTHTHIHTETQRAEVSPHPVFWCARHLAQRRRHKRKRMRLRLQVKVVPLCVCVCAQVRRGSIIPSCVHFANRTEGGKR